MFRAGCAGVVVAPRSVGLVETIIHVDIHKILKRVFCRKARKKLERAVRVLPVF